ncbi:MAG TPA: glycoside hydrolase family 3 C-terminal domain-containing protein [Bacteroidales bacterium]|nr:glycoside hydrolase family 3 C-terminal domain-containing protein [Bacteroidales bacterium]
MKKIFFMLILSALIIRVARPQNLPRLGKDPVSKVIAAMTLEEKASLVVGTGMKMPDMPGTGQKRDQQQNQPGPVVGNTKTLVDGSAGTTFAIPRLGIPAMVVADGPAGLRISPTRQGDPGTYYCTAFPVGTLLSSSWDVDLVSSVGKAMGNEVLEYGVDVLLGPGMNIHRNPLCGRNFEYFSEDPFLSGNISAAMIKGVQSNGVGVSVKHFAANNCETNRMSVNTKVSERALREIYLENFRIPVTTAHPWTVMSSYNYLNDVYASENPDLLTKILKGDWGFKGLVMTDWFGGKNPVAQMAAGNDLLMPGTPDQTKAIIAAVKDGKLDVRVLDRNVERILNIILQTPRFKGYKFSNKPDLKAHAEVARNAAAEGMVLLRNNANALPFGPDVKNVAVFGNTSYDIVKGGTGSGDVNNSYVVSVAEGISNAGYTVNEDLKMMYTKYIELIKAGRPKATFFMTPLPVPELGINSDIVKGIAAKSDVAVVTIGRNAGEGRDRTNTEGDFKLTAFESQLIKDISSAYHAKGKKVVVVLNIGGVIETASWKDQPDAILLAWQGGQETGNSVADILSGKVNPSGKLNSTFPVNYEDNPTSATFPCKETGKPAAPSGGISFMRSNPSEVTYEDGIYVGYRYFETFKVVPSYEFGYGLSYTTFGYSDLKLSSDKFNGKVTVTVTVKNTGSKAGKEVAELYLSAPQGKLDKPVEELKGFAKTKILQPGESQTLALTLDGHNLASFDPALSSWVADKGSYQVKIGASSKDIRLTGTFTLAKTLVVEKESIALVPKEKINEIRPK